MKELNNWKQVQPDQVGLENINHPVWQNKQDPDLLGYAHFQGRIDGHPNPGFMKRIKGLKDLDHPNVLNMLEYDLQAEPPFMVTELCKGGTLADVDLSTWSVNKKVICFHQICAGYGYLWENGLNKSDHNPKNIFLKEDHTPVIGDFEAAMPIDPNAEGVLQVLDQAGKCFWDIMEEQKFSVEVGQVHRRQQQVDELNQQIEELQQAKIELLNSNIRV